MKIALVMLSLIFCNICYADEFIVSSDGTVGTYIPDNSNSNTYLTNPNAVACEFEPSKKNVTEETTTVKTPAEIAKELTDKYGSAAYTKSRVYYKY